MIRSLRSIAKRAGARVRRAFSSNPQGCHVVQRWSPHGGRKPYGARIVVDRRHSANDLRALVRHLAQGRDPVVIQIYDSDDAFEAAKRGDLASNECRRGYLLSYAQRGPERHITWMQEHGYLARLFGRVEALS